MPVFVKVPVLSRNRMIEHNWSLSYQNSIYSPNAHHFFHIFELLEGASNRSLTAFILSKYTPEVILLLRLQLLLQLLPPILLLRLVLLPHCYYYNYYNFCVLVWRGIAFKNYNTHEALEVTTNVLSPKILLNEIGVLIVPATWGM